MKKISIIIPTLNEEKSVPILIRRIHDTLSKKKIIYEIIFVDDHSTDKTQEIILRLSKKYPVSLFLKIGKKGKTQSLFEGFSYAKHNLLCMIDADLQYPPEAIPAMIIKIKKGADIVVANRTVTATPLIRKVLSKSFMYIFGKVLHGFDCDVQSGLKLFKKHCILGLSSTLSSWTFDMELLRKNVDLGSKVSTVDILFEKRIYGEEKINLLRASWEIGVHAVKLKFADSFKMIPPTPRASYRKIT